MNDSTKRKTQLTMDKSKVATTVAISFLIVSLLVISSVIVGRSQPPVYALESSLESIKTPNRVQVGNEKMDSAIAAPSTISQDGSEFTTQAVIGSLSARPTNNIVNTNSFYDVVFLTASTGIIKKIEVTFPAGTTIPSGAFFNEAEGIGPGTASKSGQTITYTVTNAVNVPVGTKIRLEFANIINPIQPGASYKVTVTTRNAANAIIDGPTQSTAYTIKQIGVNAIADGHITTPKIADGAVTGSKIAGIQKLLFAHCTLPSGTGTMVPGATRVVDCNVPGAQVGDVGVAQYNGNNGGNFFIHFITIGMVVLSPNTVTLALRNDGTSDITLDGETFSLIVFKK